MQALFRGGDILAVLLAAVLAQLVFGDPATWLDGLKPVVMLELPLVFSFAASARGLYRDEAAMMHDLPAGGVLGAWLQTCGLMALLPLLLEIVSPGTMTAMMDDLKSILNERASLIFLLFSAPALVLVCRACLMVLSRRTGLRARAASRAIVFGIDPEARRLVRALAQHDTSGLAVVGFAVMPDQAAPARLDGLPVLSLGDTAAAQVCALHADCVLLSWRMPDGVAMEEVTRLLAPLPVGLKLVPDLPLHGIPIQQLETRSLVPMAVICAPPPPLWARVMKRAEDLVLAPICLLLLMPLLLATAVAIKLDSPGPVLFRQRRIGIGERHFTMLKFRTMHHSCADADGRMQTVRNDPRVTRVGAFLRRWNIDELPQLLNVILGDMSLVGPRPHALQTCAAGLPFEQAVAIYSARHRVRPGMTGWAQVNGWRGQTDTLEKLQRRVEHDLWYITNSTIGLDLLILMRTVLAMARGRNAY
jgi:Undecaprenyl-phosphate glucose phosphotransferase